LIKIGMPHDHVRRDSVVGIEGRGGEADHPPPTNTEIMNGWSY